MWAQGNLETSCGESTVQDLIHLAGGSNVCDSISNEHIVANMEQIMAWNPDIIVMWYNEKKNPSDIINNEQWKLINAVKKRRVYEFPEIFLCDLWTLKYTYAVKMVAKWTYPELFKDIDLEKEKKNHAPDTLRQKRQEFNILISIPKSTFFYFVPIPLLILSLFVGPSDVVSTHDILAWMQNRITNSPSSNQERFQMVDAIVFNVRLPRVLLAFLIGSALTVFGQLISGTF